MEIPEAMTLHDHSNHQASQTETQLSDGSIQLHPSWLTHLAGEFKLEYMQQLKHFLQAQKQEKRIIYPKGNEIFQALNTTPLNKTQVVILGQDPYHGPNQAHGLCFSVRPGIALPPSLMNIYKELQQDLNIDNLNLPNKPYGCLTQWAEQGVLLLNSVLTVERGQAASHQGKGWERFTDAVIDVVNRHQQHVVFLLWGSYAMKKGHQINRDNHLVLTAPHPSPLSAHRGFFGCKHFSQANTYLEQHQRHPINWQLAPDTEHYEAR